MPYPSCITPRKEIPYIYSVKKSVKNRNLTIFKNTSWLKLFSIPAGLCLNGACVYACFSIITWADRKVLRMLLLLFPGIRRGNAVLSFVKVILMCLNLQLDRCGLQYLVTVSGSTWYVLSWRMRKTSV